MANTITKAKMYVTLLDELYRDALKTDVLSAPSELIRAGNSAGEVLIPKITLDALGDYSRANGYPSGDITFEWETHTFSYDRAIEFTLDKQNNLEALDIPFTAASNQFVKQYAAPEIDAVRFAEMYGSAGTTVQADLSVTDTVEAIDTAIAEMRNAEVSKEGMYLFLTTTVLKNIKNSELFDRDINTVGDRSIPAYDGIPIIVVPQGRFYSAITLNDGSTTFGYEKDGTDGADLNFMIVHSQAALPVVKQQNMKIFTPEQNQTKDGWLMQYRLYHDIFTPDNKVNGIYAHEALL
jgi:hypothetical protein